ncbi:MAG: membrane integrity-associated transporter subunit PqiC [Opitutales bacterium]|nr:membrane integrity-associated transporter subunit PqiC [Opitutales bacterium]
MNKPILASIGLLLLAGFFLGGCRVFEPVVDETRHFTLRTSAQMDFPLAGSTDDSLYLGAVRLPDFLDNRRVLYREGPRVISDSQGMWIEPFADGLRAAFVEEFREQGFAVHRSRPAARRLDITVMRWDAFVDGRIFAEIQWQAGDQSGTLAAQASWQRRDIPSLVAAYREIVHGMTERLLADLAHTESSDF